MLPAKSIPCRPLDRTWERFSLTGVVVMVTYDVIRHEVLKKRLDCKPWQPY